MKPWKDIKYIVKKTLIIFLKWNNNDHEKYVDFKKPLILKKYNPNKNETLKKR